MRIEGLKKCRHRPSIEDLPKPYRSDAWHWYHRIPRRRQSLGKPTREPWLRAILMGQAKRLALNPPTSAWGRSMLTKTGTKLLDFGLAKLQQQDAAKDFPRAQ
jgi:hypothetical protein